MNINKIGRGKISSAYLHRVQIFYNIYNMLVF